MGFLSMTFPGSCPAPRRRQFLTHTRSSASLPSCRRPLPPSKSFSESEVVADESSGEGERADDTGVEAEVDEVVGIELSPLSLALLGNHALSALTPLLSKPATSSRGDSIHLCPFFGSPQRLHL